MLWQSIRSSRRMPRQTVATTVGERRKLVLKDGTNGSPRSDQPARGLFGDPGWGSAW